MTDHSTLDATFTHRDSSRGLRLACLLVLVAVGCGSKHYDSPAESAKGTFHAMIRAIHDGDEEALWANVSTKSLHDSALEIALDVWKKDPATTSTLARNLGITPDEFGRLTPELLLKKMWIPGFMRLKDRMSDEAIEALPVRYDGDTAAITAPDTAFAIHFVREDGVWKVDANALAMATIEARQKN